MKKLLRGIAIAVVGLLLVAGAVSVADFETKRAFLTAMKAKYEHDFGFDPEFYQRAWDTGEFILLRMEPR